MVASPLHVVTDAAEDVSEYHIEAQTSLVERSLRTLKHGDAFAVLDAYGDIGAIENTAEGLFFRDMRHLSRFQLWFAGRRPLLLSSVMQDDNAALSVDMTNPDIEVPNGEKVHLRPQLRPACPPPAYRLQLRRRLQGSVRGSGRRSHSPRQRLH
jgi:hypothetical protein